MRLRLLLILTAFILAACGQSEPPAKGEAGPPGPAGPPVPPVLLVPVPAITDRRSTLSQEPVNKQRAARAARRMSKSSMPMRSIQEALLAL